MASEAVGRVAERLRPAEPRRSEHEWIHETRGTALVCNYPRRMTCQKSYLKSNGSGLGVEQREQQVVRFREIQRIAKRGRPSYNLSNTVMRTCQCVQELTVAHRTRRTMPPFLKTQVIRNPTLLPPSALLPPSSTPFPTPTQS